MNLRSGRYDNRRLLDLLTLAVTAAVVAGCGAEPVKIPVYGLLGEIAVGEDSVWVTQRGVEESTPAVLKIDPTVNQVVASIPIEGFDYWGGLAVGAGGVWVTEGEKGRYLHRIDPRANRIVASIQTPEPPQMVVAEGGSVWVAGQKGVYRIDPGTNRVDRSISLSTDVWLHLLVGHGALWVATGPGGYLYRVEPETGVIVTTRVPSQPVTSAVLGAGSIWLVHGTPRMHEKGVVTRIDPETGKVIGEPLVVGPLPRLAIGGGFLWLASAVEGGGASVSRLDPQTFQEVGRPTRISGLVTRIAFGFDSLWAISPSAPRTGRPSLVQRIKR